MAQDWVSYALNGNAVWSIGQLDKATIRALNALVRRGVLVTSRLSWCNISTAKTVWHLPTVAP